MSASGERGWPWWPLLPLYPYGQRRTLLRELVADQVWGFEQLHGVLYVAVPIRMSVVRVAGGLMLYAPVPPTDEVRRELRRLEQRWGPVRTIVLPTSSGLEHKVPVPAMARAFPAATVWVSPYQWSFPVPLPLPWLGFPGDRTRVLLADGVPHPGELSWFPLGPLHLGLGTFMEVACFHKASGSLLLTDALVGIPAHPPALFEEDPTPLLFHARDQGQEPLLDSPERRRRGWRRMVLFASFLQPAGVRVPPLREVLAQAWAPGLRRAAAYFGFYPFRWEDGWEREFEALLNDGALRLQVAPVLERLVFPRSRETLLAWLRQVSAIEGLARLIPAHYAAPLDCSAADLLALAAELERRPWAPSGGSWEFLANLDARLLQWGLVPERPLTLEPSADGGEEPGKGTDLRG